MTKIIKKELLTEQQAADLLHITLRSLQNMVSSGRMPRDCYIKTVTGKRFYYEHKLLGKIS
jgi:hypothetical protein